MIFDGMRYLSAMCIGLSLFILAGCSGSSPQPGAGNTSAGESKTLLNVSYDPTRELWKEVNDKFISQYQKSHQIQLEIKQSHGGSASQSRAIIDGLSADVATLAMWFDTDAIRKKGLIQAGWEDRFPNRSLPYTSTIVFVVRKGNPKRVKDWPDLVNPGIEIITPNPKTGANGKLSFLAAWGSVLVRGGKDDDAQEFVRKLYAQVPVLDSAARAATTTFSQKGIGDVHLTWENEAHLEVAEAGGELEIVYPSNSIQAEPHVAIVDANADRNGTREIAEAYLNFLYTPEGQDIIAKHYYRPSEPDALKRHAEKFPKIDLYQITKIATDWEEAHKRFFAEGALFDSIYRKKGG